MADSLLRHGARRAIIIILLIALLGGAVPIAPVAQAATPDTGGQWRAIPQPREARTEHTATTLADGRVLVAGATTELYDPATNRWTAGPPQRSGGAGVTATLLPDGRVLAAGNEAEIYNPAIDRWTPVAAPTTRRVTFGAAPTTRRVTFGAAPTTRRVTFGAAPLPGGRVLLLGDTDHGPDAKAVAEIFDPATETWRPAAPPSSSRLGNISIVPLPDGRILLPSSGPAGSAIYDPAADRWLPAAPSLVARSRATTTVLRDGRVLVVGGDFSDYPETATAELYDPAVDTWTLTTPPLLAHRGAAAAALPDGRVLVVGDPTAQRNADLYDPTAPPVRCFTETGKCLRGRFLDYWNAHGGLALNGYPLSDERVEYLEDGALHQVQYFERTRLEYHLAAAPYDIQLGQFGRRFHPGGTFRNPEPLAPPIPGATYFTETGHNLGGRFLDYWQANGGLAQFGYPITEEGREGLEDGKEYLVQYFERARFEYHPENADPAQQVLLGQFGRLILAEADLLAGPFARLYNSDPALRIQLGPPVSRPTTVPGAVLAFDRGGMLYRADTRQILALCDRDSGASGGRWWAFPDTWDEGQPAGGGPGPRAQVYEPGRGFGKVWRENPAVRDCLGYARNPGETGRPLTFQRFARGQIASALAYFPDLSFYVLSGRIVLYDDGTYETYNP